MDEAAGPGTIDSADFAARPVIQSDLVAFTVGTYAEEDAAVKGPVDFCFEQELEVAELSECGKEAALPGWVLYADDSVIFYEPLAGQTVVGQVIVSFPAGQVAAVEQGLESFRRPVRPVLCRASGKNQRGR